MESPHSEPATVLAISLTDAGMAIGLRRLTTNHGQQISQTDFVVDPAADKHSDRLLTLVDELITGCGLTSEALSALAFDAGPGGFTRVRIACAVTQGLAMGLGVPVAAVDSLQAIALASANETEPDDWVVCSDARMGQCYVGRYALRPDGALHELMAAQTMDTDRVSAWLQTAHAQTPASGFAGSAFSRFEHLQTGLPRPAHQPGAAAVAGAVLELATTQAQWMPAAQAAPLYVREKVALNVQEQAALRASKRAAPPG